MTDRHSSQIEVKVSALTSTSMKTLSKLLFIFKCNLMNWVWWCMPLIPVQAGWGRWMVNLRSACLGYSARPCLKQTKLIWPVFQLFCFVLWDSVSQHIPSCPRNWYVDQACLRLTGIHWHLPQSASIKGVRH